MTSAQRPALGSHDPRVPTGSLELSAATIYEAALAARDAESREDDDSSALHAFYRAVISGTLLLPVPPEHGDEARQALASAVNDDAEVEVNVLLARDADGEPISVVFASLAALAAWAPSHSGSLPLPARIAVANLAASGLPAVLDPAGPLPYRFEPDELAALAEGRLPGGDEPLVAATTRHSIRVRLSARDTRSLERTLATRLRETNVEAAYLVDREGPDGVARLTLGLVCKPADVAQVHAPDDIVVEQLNEPLLAQVRALTAPFYRRAP